MSEAPSPLVAVVAALAVVAVLVSCGRDEPREPPPDSTVAEVAWTAEDTLSPDEIEEGRLDDDWRAGLTIEAPPVRELGLDTIEIPESWGDIGEIGYDVAVPEAVNLPLAGDIEGPSVLFVEVLLDRSRFSPGVLDGKWDKNTEKAVLWFQHREELEPTGAVDSLTFARLTEAAGAPASYVIERAVTEDDLAGPYVAIPADVYRQARLDCLCYESIVERLSERYHAAPELLAELNPGVSLDSLSVGDTIRVPAIDRDRAEDETEVARLLVSGLGFHLHALDADGRILYHFPTTLGSRYDPSPEGTYEVVSIHPDPWFHYQPALLAGVDASLPNTHLPPGPNNLVGDTWIKLSKPHYGIHGTRAPETIGYATSSGCVRLTNWDARFLRDRIRAGTAVEFEHTRTSPDAVEEAPAGDDAPAEGG